MKKLTLWLILIIMALTLAACGEGATKSVSDQADKPDSSDESQEQEFEAFSTEAVEYYLDAYGLELKDIAPDWSYTVRDKHAYADSPGSSGHATIIFSKDPEGEVTAEEYDAWMKKLFDATAAISDDGYNIIGHEFVGEGENALDKVTLEQAKEGWIQGWGFRKNGQNMVVYTNQKYDNNKDSQIGELLYYYGVNADIGVGLQKDFSDTLNDMEDALKENEDEIKDALSDYLS